MITYVSLPIKLVQLNIPNSQKLLFGLLTVLTKKGTVKTTASNKYLGNLLGDKSDSQVSMMLKGLQEISFIEMKREMGRRQIGLNTKDLVEAGYLAKLREKKKY